MHVTLLALGILRWLLDFYQMYAPLNSVVRLDIHKVGLSVALRGSTQKQQAGTEC
jgi:hypothetical protein